MKRTLIALVAAAITLAACSGNFATGTGVPQQGGLPPMSGDQTPMPQTDKNGLPTTGSPTPNASVSPGAVVNASYPLTDATKGFACPSMSEGYDCTLAFNLPAPTPTPAASGKGKSSKTASSSPKPTATPSPSPTPSPTPQSSGSPAASAAPSATPSPAPSIKLMAQAPPQHAPAMVHIPVNTLDTVPLFMVQLETTANFALDGWAQAHFTLPAAELDGRGFALQLFQATQHHKKVDYKALWTFDKSTRDGNTLTFSFAEPKLSIAKGSTYVLVLYGDDTSKALPSSSASPQGSATPAEASSQAPASTQPEATPASSPSP